MFSWTPYALVRVTLVFIAGIVSGLYLPDVSPVPYINLLFAGFSTTFIVLAYLKWKGWFKYVNIGFLALIALFLAGYLNVYYATDYHRADHFIHNDASIGYYQVRLAGQSQEKQNSWKAEAEVMAIRLDSGSWIPRSGKVLLYFNKKDYPDPFQYGDVLLVRGKPQALQEPSNPGEFNYRTFLSYRKIYHQHFVRGGEVIHIDHKPASRILAYSIKAREWADRAIKKYVPGSREQATASALVLGVTDGLDSELIGAYAATGSLHVLSVSGLHVGIIYWLLLLIFRPLNKTTQGKWVLSVVSVLVLWAYAFVTGVSPSVLRAVTMFSFVALGRPWKQTSNMYNTLAASAFCLLVYEPYLIMSVGFQLSYLAVIGIVYIQPKLAAWWIPKQWLWEQVWQITCVSIAAQLATVALGLFYFHQFPVYFLISNLFVIPVSFMVLVLGIVVVATSAIAPVAAFLGWVLQWIISFMNHGLFYLEEVPGNLIDQVYINATQCWLLMGAIVCLALLLRFRRTRYLTAATAWMFMFGVLQWIHLAEDIQSKKFVVYQVSGHTAWDLLQNGHAYFFADSALVNDPDKIRFHISPNRLRQGVSEVNDGRRQSFTAVLPGGTLVVWNGLKIFQVDQPDGTIPANAEVDYVVVSDNSLRSVASLKSLKFRKLILDSSNSFYFAERLLKDARAEGIPVHSVQHHGAFIVNLTADESG